MRLDHPHIVKITDVILEKNTLVIVSEYCSGGKLFKKISTNKYFKNEEAKHYFSQIIEVIHFCHVSGICHRNLKPENCLIESINSSDFLKVANFQLSKYIKSDKLIRESTSINSSIYQNSLKTGNPNKTKNSTRIENMYYTAPEVFKGEYDERCDLWSAGVILYVLCCGYVPFSGKNQNKL